MGFRRFWVACCIGLPKEDEEGPEGFAPLDCRHSRPVYGGSPCCARQENQETKKAAVAEACARNSCSWWSLVGKCEGKPWFQRSFLGFTTKQAPDDGEIVAMPAKQEASQLVKQTSMVGRRRLSRGFKVEYKRCTYRNTTACYMYFVYILMVYMHEVQSVRLNTRWPLAAPCNKTCPSG